MGLSCCYRTAGSQWCGRFVSMLRTCVLDVWITSCILPFVFLSSSVFAFLYCFLPSFYLFFFCPLIFTPFPPSSFFFFVFLYCLLFSFSAHLHCILCSFRRRRPRPPPPPPVVPLPFLLLLFCFLLLLLLLLSSLSLCPLILPFVVLLKFYCFFSALLYCLLSSFRLFVFLPSYIACCLPFIFSSCNGAEWSKDRTQAAESIKWKPQQAYSSNQVLLSQPQTIFSTHKILTLTHR